MELKFENRNNSSNPIIKRIAYKNVYIYIIETLTGCDCNYIGCDSYKSYGRVVLKVRKASENKKDCDLILTKNGRAKVKIKVTDKISELETIELFNKYYNIN